MLQKFKSEVAYKAKESISIFQSGLEKERIRLQVSYSGIFEKQAEVIIHLFKLLVNFENTINCALYDLSNEKNEFEKFVKAWRELFDYFQLNRILLPKDLDEFIYKFQNDIFFGVDEYRRVEKRISGSNLEGSQIDKYFAQQDIILKDLDEIKNLKDELTHQFRMIIGVTE